MARKDPRGRNLKEGESYRSDGRYSYRYTDSRTGKRRNIYSYNLAELREKEKQIQRDIDEGILTDASARQMTVNDLFGRYMASKKLKDTTRINYVSTWNNHVRDELGNMRVVQVKLSHVKVFYAKLSREGYSRSTIKLINNLLYPSFEMAVDDDMIRKNPAKKAMDDYGEPSKERTALTPAQQAKLLDFVRNSNVYKVYLPLLVVMIGTGCRCGELISLCWDDVNLKKNEISIRQQLVYKNYGDGCKFHDSTPKTEAGIRVIPMSNDVHWAFEEQKKLNIMRGIPRDVEVGGRIGFIFTSKTGRPMMPNALNNVLYNIVNAYNKLETETAKAEKRQEELMPRISAHSLRHTGCTRMAEMGLDMKCVQYVMGHANIGVTMEVYNHITEKARIEKEIAKMNAVKVV